MPTHRRQSRRRKLSLEMLEPRIVLDAGPLITEFMAVNDSTLADGDGKFSDWIEIHNPTSAAIELDDWYLTDNADNLTKWQFPNPTIDPDITIQPGGYLVVFASNSREDVPDPHDPVWDAAGNLHTDFKLSGGGEDVALVRPDGLTVAHAFLGYPEQVADLSYGITVPNPFFAELVGAGDSATYHVPTATEDVFAWTAPNYDDSAWASPATTGIGFSNNQPAFDNLIGTDVEAAMRGENASLWIRIEFQADDAPSVWDKMTLRMKYDDGFVAYLNGAEIVQQNAPVDLAFDSAATAAHPDTEAVVFEDIDASDALTSLNVGTNVLAIHGLNAAVNDPDFLILPELTVGANLADPFYMETATPGAVNAAGVQELVADTKFSLDRGFYDEPQVVEITTATAGATIMYTTDGSAPTETHGTEYTVPIDIDTTTTLRAMAFKPGALSTNIDTLTYIFLEDVIHQTGAGYPQDWGGGYVGDYQMSPQVVNDPRYADTIKDDLLSIPTLSLVTDIDNLFDPSIGIYYNSGGRGAAWERPVSVELIGTDGSTEFQIDAGLRVHGGAGRGRGNAKHSLRLVFKDEYGAGKLDYPLFTYDDPEAATSFDSLVLRAGFNDQYHATPAATFIQDPWIARTQNLNGGYGPHGTWVHLYINGLYWGLYNPVERPGASFAASYFGHDKEDYDAYHTNQLKDGNSASWNEMFSLVRAPTIDYAAVQQKLDIPNFIDYMIINQYGGNRDWPHNNWDATAYRYGGKWYFHSWDAEFSLRDVNNNNINRDYGGAAGELFERLVAVPEFRMTYADRIHRLMFNDGLLTPAKAIETLNFLTDQIDRAIVGETARWGDGSYSSRGTSATLDGNWLPRIDWLRNTYFPQRTAIVFNQFRTSTFYPGLYPDIEAPTFSQHGGDLLPDDTLTVSAPAGVIYYMIDGSDPRLEGGAIHPDAIAIASGGEILLLQSSVVKSRVYLDDDPNDEIPGEWSALNEASFHVTLTGVTMNIDGVPSQGGTVPLDQTLTLTAPNGTIYYTLDGTDPRQADGQILPEALSIASGAPVPLNQSASVTTRAWLNDVWSPLNQAVFLLDTPFGPHHLVVSEINYNPYDPTPAELAVNPGFTGTEFEYVELQYVGTDSLNLSGVQLVNGVNFDFGQPSPITLGPGEFVVVVANQQAFAARYGTGGITVAGEYNGNLNDGGEGITLTGPFGETILDFSYNDGGSWPGRADGRGASLELIDSYAVPSGVPESNPARTAYLEDGDHWRGSEFGGSPGFVGNPVYVDVIVNEVLSHTDFPQYDSIELYNTTGVPIDLGGWYLSDSWGLASNPDTGNYKKYRIPNGTIIPAHDYLVFDEDQHFNTSQGTDPDDFSLNGAHGDDVWLMQADLAGNLFRFADHVEFGAAANGETFGRWPNAQGDLHPMTENTLGDANSGPRVGGVIISEVMYHPLPPTPADLAYYPELVESDLEYIEIYNATGTAVSLNNWRLRGDADFDFPSGITLSSGQARVILPFNPFALDEQGQPVNQDRTKAFRNHYQLPNYVQLIGGYQGQLDNAGDRVQLQRPDEEPADEPGFYPGLWEDQIFYDEAAPWPTEADGTGQSLSRYLPAAWGDSAASWNSADPRPGIHLLRVVAVTPTASGFSLQFDRPFDPTELNLYDVEEGTFGPPDVTLTGTSTGPVSGSLVLEENRLSFVATGGPLLTDEYTITVRSGSDGFQDLSGRLLDGTGNWPPGSDFVDQFTITSEPVFVGLPDFSRGPRQDVNVPATGSGIPLMLTDNRGGGPDIGYVGVTVTYDPALLTITDVQAGPDAPDGATLVADTNTPGLVTLTLTGSFSPLPADALHIVTFTATVPAAASYGGSHILAFTQVDLQDTTGAAIDAAADNALHSVIYFGDSTGNGTYSGLDAQRVARIGVGLDSGLSAFPLTDPLVLADISGNGTLGGLDAQRIALTAAGLEAEGIPSLPPPQAQRLAEIPQTVADEAPLTVQTSGVGDTLGVSPTPEVFLAEPLRIPAIDLAFAQSKHEVRSTKGEVQPARQNSPIPHSALRIPHSPPLPLTGDRLAADSWRFTENEFDGSSKAAKMELHGEIGLWTPRLLDQVFAVRPAKRAI